MEEKMRNYEDVQRRAQEEARQLDREMQDVQGQLQAASAGQAGPGRRALKDRLAELAGRRRELEEEARRAASGEIDWLLDSMKYLRDYEEQRAPSPPPLPAAQVHKRRRHGHHEGGRGCDGDNEPCSPVVRR
eukprot:tig00000492_g1394.t1